MADNTTEIVGIKSGVLEKALKKDGIPGWATEKTLYKISKTLDDLVKGNAGISKALHESSNDTDELAKILAKLGKGKGKPETELSDAERTAKNILERWGSAQLILLNGITKLFPIMRDTVMTSVNAFTDLYQAGISLGNSYAEATDSFDTMRHMVIDTGMKLNDFAAAIKNYSIGVNAIGASKLAKVMPAVSSNLTKFGYDLAGAAETIGAYTDIQVALGNLQNKSNKEIEQEAAELGKSMSMLAGITGQARNKLLEQTRAMAASIEANLISLKQGEAAGRAAAAFSASFKDSDVGKRFIEMMAAEVPVLNSTFQTLAKSGVGPFAERMISFSKGIKNLKPEEQMIALKNFLGNNSEYIKQEMQRLQPLAEAGVEGARESLEILTKLNQQHESLRNKTEEEIRKEQEANAAINDLKKEWTTLMSTFAKIFQPSIGLMRGLTWVLGKVNSAINNTIEAFSGVSALGVSFGELATITIALGAAVLGVIKAISIAGALKTMISGGGVGSASSAAGGAVGSAASSVGKGLGSLGKGIGSGFSSAMSGLAQGLAAFGGPLGLKAVAGAALLGAAIAALVTTISAGASAAMWMMSKTMPEFAKSLSTFDMVNGDNLKSVGSGLVTLGAGLAVFTAANTGSNALNMFSNTFKAITSFLGGKDTISQIKEFASMGDSLGKAGSGMQIFNTELNRLMNTDISKLDAVAVGLSKLSAPVSNLSKAVPGETDTTQLSAATKKVEKTLRESPKAPIGHESLSSGTSNSEIVAMLAVQVKKFDEVIQQLKDNYNLTRDILKYSKIQA